MLVICIFHNDVVCLIPYIGTVAVRAVGCEVGILVDIHALCGNALILIGFIESLDELVNISDLNSGIVFKNLDDCTLFKLTGETGHYLLVKLGDLSIGRGVADAGFTASDDYGCSKDECKKDSKKLFHGIFLLKSP